MLIGDHGWSLGDHGAWCKHSNFSVVNRAPMIFSGAGVPKGKTIEEVVEFVDLYPSICDFAGLPIPVQCEGSSVKMLSQGKDQNWRNSAVVKWQTGVSLMTPQYRYTEWRNADNNIVAQMMFDCKKDPLENQNLISDPSYQEIIAQMQKRLEEAKGKDFYKK